ncbi:hypothetical protein EOD23_34150, partial [Mesorhizobium sp. USDA-HM6]
RTLGRSGLKVSTLTLGTMTFGGERARAAESHRAKRQCRNLQAGTAKGAVFHVGVLAILFLKRRAVAGAGKGEGICRTIPTACRPAIDTGRSHIG